MDQIATVNRRIPQRPWLSLRFAIACMLLLMAGAPNTYATSQCWEWDAEWAAAGPNGRLVYSTTGWQNSPYTACTLAASMISANPASLFGVNPNISYSSWSGAFTYSATFPMGTCTLTYSWVYIPNGNHGTDQTTNAGIAVIHNPAGCNTYLFALPKTAAQCGPARSCAGDPINPASGAVFDTIVDSPSTTGSVSFNRFYNSTDSGGPDVSAGWRHSFSRSLTPVYSSSTYKPYVVSPDNSSLYTDEATACTSGFAEIKSRVSTWASATATYSNGACAIRMGTQTIATLPILYTSPPTPAPGSTVLIGYDVTRDDGQLISFTVNGTAIVAPPSIPMTLQQTASGFTLTDPADNVEQYDSSGRLLSITSRAGVVQTMGYDTSNRLSTVTDSFGHGLSLTYDSQNRLSSVTRQ